MRLYSAVYVAATARSLVGRRQHRSLNRLVSALEPSRLVPPGRVVVRPVDGSTLLVPGILAAKLDHVADAQGREARCDVDVVCDEERLAGGEPECEALVAAAFNVIAQDPRHSAGVLDLDGGLARLERIGDCLIRRTGTAGRTRDRGRTATREQCSQHEHDQDESLHATSFESSDGMSRTSCASNCLG